MKVRIKLGKVKKFGIGWCIPHKMAADRVKHDKVHPKLKQSQLLLPFFHLGSLLIHTLDII